MLTTKINPTQLLFHFSAHKMRRNYDFTLTT